MHVTMKLDQLQKAMAKCLEANPPVKGESLCPDACLMAEVYGQGVCAKVDEVNLSDFSARHVQAIAKWADIPSSVIAMLDKKD